MSIKHLKIANYSRALMAQKARKQMALINQCNLRKVATLLKLRSLKIRKL